MLNGFLSRRAALAAMTGAALGLASAATADTTRLRMHTYYGTEIDDIAKKLRDTVKEKSNGELRIQYFRGGELVPTDQLLDAVKSGTVDIVHGTGGYWSGQVDIGNIDAGLPGFWTSVEEAKELFGKEEVQQILTDAYSDAGAHFIQKGYGHDYDLLTKEPVNSLEDLKTRKIRATSAVAKVLEKFDIPTVFLPAQELYIGLSTGVIDGAIYGGPVEYEQLKLNETAKYYTYLNVLMPGWTDSYLANKDTWAELSDEHKKILEDALAVYAQDIYDWLDENNAAVAEKGDVFEFSELPAEDSKAMTRAAKDVVWSEEAARSDRAKRLIEIIEENAKAQGRL
ncbi:ABC transporter substrate-binding protein [Roseovarius spongiae]|uniref:ABC transporter substrate-binding protein n=1 Tax=Roseovarius spongiae TaxID=2320272 RepID=A0A3A8AQP2_9RHOB|nr:TRAP transporter substrate-binding protein [Roseovarius spongiae]RKF12702.1 ABC transporter substrate-binding protein [Roseovarius spongiae]